MVIQILCRKEEKDKNERQNYRTKILGPKLNKNASLDYCEKDVDETEHIFYGVLKDLEKILRQ